MSCSRKDGKTATRTDARGKVTTYAYNDYGELVSQDYSDDTADIVMVYDTLGRVTQVTDAAGVTTFTYNQYGELESEANLRTLMRHYDNYGRDVGWSLNGSRKNIIQYDNATGRLYRMKAGGAWFTWSYLPGTNLKSQLTYGGSGNTTWEYEPNRDLLTRVKNTIYGAVASQYDYTNDIGGRRTQIGKSGTMMAQNEVQNYGYNTRDELISGQGLTYNYDDIGNRTTAEGKTYTANNLNQYTAIDTFAPQYDADGNQTLIKTSTGIWSVTYNAENRPVRWVKDNIVITMNFDRMGRRVFYKEEVNGEVTKHHRFVYDNYLCVQKVDALNNNSQINLFVWDPTEPVATRPLFTTGSGNRKFFYTCDGNKNVSELVHFETRNGIAAHYDYAPFGAVTRAISASAITDNTFTTDNPFRFSSEYHDDTLGLVYYNYRHYNPIDGRWCGRDRLSEEITPNLYLFSENAGLLWFDYNGDIAFCAPILVFWAPSATAWMWAGIATVSVTTVAYIVDVYERKTTYSYTLTTYNEECNECVAREAISGSVTVVEQKSEVRQKKQSPCKPCIPPVGTIKFDHYDMSGATHKGVKTPHTHFKRMHQNPTTCVCFWNDFEVRPFQEVDARMPNPNPETQTSPSQNGGGFLE